MTEEGKGKDRPCGTGSDVGELKKNKITCRDKRLTRAHIFQEIKSMMSLRLQREIMCNKVKGVNIWGSIRIRISECHRNRGE